MPNRAPPAANGAAHEPKLARCSSSVGDSADKPRAGWNSPRDIWRNLSLRRKAELRAPVSPTRKVCHRSTGGWSPGLWPRAERVTLAVRIVQNGSGVPTSRRTAPRSSTPRSFISARYLIPPLDARR
ncbi:hypothetical protein EVAR_18637_1 [Eumeta japonica]|uniref:Uncharacterized protein n=1 Tax=Eumeta variegata TaxID=151549 RepID=A0A4C1U813_EUMVA|nr:hypothetical protein EVAR_18637_1 [Eumeta japonica]